MPTTSITTEGPTVLSDAFTLLVIPSFNGDVGQRPSRRRFSYKPAEVTGLVMLDQNEKKVDKTVRIDDDVSIRVTVENHGTVDVPVALVECYWSPHRNHVPLHDHSKYLHVHSDTVRHIPAQRGYRVDGIHAKDVSSKTLDFAWRIPGVISRPAEPDLAIHVRVVDLSSFLKHPRLASWRAEENPQVTHLLIEHVLPPEVSPIRPPRPIGIN